VGSPLVAGALGVSVVPAGSAGLVSVWAAAVVGAEAAGVSADLSSSPKVTVQAEANGTRAKAAAVATRRAERRIETVLSTWLS